MRKEPIYTIIILMVVFSIVYWGATPFFREWQGAKAELAVINEKLAAAAQIKAEVGAFDEQNYFEELSKLDYAFPVDSGRAELTVMLETLTVNNGLLLNSVKFTENRKSGLDPIDLSQEAARAKAEATVSDSERVSLEIELSGTYGSFKNFLKNCEENARVLNIQEVGFGAQKSSAVVSQPGQEAVIFDFKIKMETYFLSV